MSGHTYISIYTGIYILILAYKGGSSRRLVEVTYEKLCTWYYDSHPMKGT
jgi:hypothetical protein